MTDTPTTHSKHPPEARRNGGGSRHNSDADNSSAPSATRNRSDSATPTRPSPAPQARQTNSTPRLRSRPAPVRSLSTPLARSLSVRVSKKEKRWSMRLADPRSPRISTYQDDYQSPDALSLQSLNLETTTERGGAAFDPNASTTYRESYKWQPDWLSSPPTAANKILGRSTSDDSDNPSRHSGSNPASVSHGSCDDSASSNGPVSPNRTSSSRNGQTTSGPNTRGETSSTSRPVPPRSTISSRLSSFFRRNHSSGVIQSGTDGQNLSSADKKSSSSSSKQDSASTKAANDKSVRSPKPANANTPSVNGVGLQNPGTPQAQTVSNSNRVSTSNRGGNVSTPVSEDRTPRRMRAYQLQSSNGGSPFVYGSDSGHWV